MNLVIDIGNTFAKVAIVDRGEIVARETQPQLERDLLLRLLERHPETDRAILSTTRLADSATEAFIERQVGRLIRFGAQTPVPLRNGYATPETLGADRMAAAVGAWGRAPGRELLIFDFGSAITIDRVSAAGEYLGGNISPGMTMRFEALHRLTDRLPLCGAPAGETTLTGRTTRQAIESGVAVGIVHEIEGYIDRIGAQNSDLALFFAGRDANFFADKVKKPIFVTHDLVIEGLNRILEYNAQLNS
ncbi:type III pantothenate kinase [uncultured Rikenella sp.]|uniref:type III pantothenate kinase n=1 Tax=uncultured Rikenella sp. TaxID=368003 RepID=UPI002614F408|nr:type III pantothenate kinase [uncultured Rikenella sp.]